MTRVRRSWQLILAISGYGSLALCFGSSVVQRRYRRVKASLERIFGALLMVFGVKLVWNGARA